jgi:hypothetical protein
LIFKTLKFGKFEKLNLKLKKLENLNLILFIKNPKESSGWLI